MCIETDASHSLELLKKTKKTKKNQKTNNQPAGLARQMDFS